MWDSRPRMSVASWFVRWIICTASQICTASHRCCACVRAWGNRAAACISASDLSEIQACDDVKIQDPSLTRRASRTFKNASLRQSAQPCRWQTQTRNSSLPNASTRGHHVINGRGFALGQAHTSGVTSTGSHPCHKECPGHGQKERRTGSGLFTVVHCATKE